MLGGLHQYQSKPAQLEPIWTKSVQIVPNRSNWIKGPTNSKELACLKHWLHLFLYGWFLLIEYFSLIECSQLRCGMLKLLLIYVLCVSFLPQISWWSDSLPCLTPTPPILLLVFCHRLLPWHKRNDIWKGLVGRRLGQTETHHKSINYTSK